MSINPILVLTLPKDVIAYILEYDTIIKYRKGVFRTQICPDDPRYNLLKTLSPIKTGYLRDIPQYYYHQLQKHKLIYLARGARKSPYNNIKFVASY
jgi:hypothetical protein